MSKFFYLGANIQQDVLGIIREAEDAFVLYEREDTHHVTETLDQLERIGRAYSIDRSAVESFSHHPFESCVDQRERVLRAVLNDFRVFLLRMRFLRVDYQGAFKGFCYFSDVVYYAMTLAKHHRPEMVFCAYTPHTVESWIIVRTFEELGAKVVRLISSPLPWVYLPVQGLLNRTGCVLKAKQRRQANYLAINKYLKKLSGDYSSAKPYYEKLESKYSLSQLLRSFRFLHPRSIAHRMEKWIVWREFQAAVTPILDGESFGVYFLHYQPEMNTLPEAEHYCDQFHAVGKLAASLPDGVKLLIKEHPSSFAKRCDRRWRPEGFYSRLLSLPNVRICPIETEVFELIDRSIFVASIVGVCLTEALARGKPAVTFNSPRFDCFSGVLVIDANMLSQSELRSIMVDLDNRKECSTGGDYLIRSLINTSNLGYDGSSSDLDIPDSAEEQNQVWRRIGFEYISDALDGWF